MLIIFVGNVLSQGWLLRFLGGFAFSDVHIVFDTAKVNSDDLLDKDFKDISGNRR